MKRWFVIVTVCLLFFSLTACDKKTESSESTNVFEDVQDAASAVAEKNEGKSAGKYVLAKEGDFDTEEVDGGISIVGYSGEDKAIIIPDAIRDAAVKQIGMSAFSGTAITGVQIADSVEIVGEKAFTYCMDLLEVKCGKNVTTIEAHAFEWCPSLARVELNDSLKQIKDSAFIACSSLDAISFPNGLSEIGKGAFAMTALKTVNVPGTVETITEEAFSSCDSLTELIINAGTKALDINACSYCKNLKKVVLPDTVQEMDSWAFQNCNANLTIYAPAGSYAESFAKENEIAFKAS